MTVLAAAYATELAKDDDYRSVRSHD